MYVSMKAVGTWFFYDQSVSFLQILFCDACSFGKALGIPWCKSVTRQPITKKQSAKLSIWAVEDIIPKKIGETNSRVNMPVKNETLKNSDQIMCDRTIQKVFGTRDFILHKLENFCTPRWSNVVLMLLTKKDDKNGSLKIIHSRSLSCQDWVSDTQCHAMVIQVKLLCRMVIGQQDFCSVGII